MLKRTIVVLVIGGCVGIAHGKANKIKFFTPTPKQVADSADKLGPDADPDGMAILNYIGPQDRTIIQIIVSDMTPNLSYSVQLVNCPGGPFPLDVLVTDEDGNGTLHQERTGDVSTCDVELFVATAGAGLVWSQPPDQDVFQPTAMVRTAVDPPAVTQLIADDFVLATGETVTKVRWWGGTCGDPEITLFRIQFFDLVTGAPGSVLQTVATGSLTPVPTTETLDCGFLEAKFEFDITPPFAPGPGTYFFSVAGVDDDAATPNFVWTGASSPAGAAFVGTSSNEIEPTTFNALGSQVAFELDGEGDSTELRATGVNLN